MLSVVLEREQERIEVVIDGPRVERRGPAGAEEQRFASAEVAACVFEANVHALERQGWLVGHHHCTGGLPPLFRTMESDDLYVFAETSGAVDVSIEVEPVSLFDCTQPGLRGSEPFGEFDPASADPISEVLHVLRLVEHHPRFTTLAHLEIDVDSHHEQLMGALAASRLGAALTHLALSDRFPHDVEIELATICPALRVLEVAARSLRSLGERPLPHLEAMTLAMRQPMSLTSLSGRAPNLRRLRLRTSSNGVEPVLRALETIEWSALERVVVEAPTHRTGAGRIIEALHGLPDSVQPALRTSGVAPADSTLGRVEWQKLDARTLDPDFSLRARYP